MKSTFKALNFNMELKAAFSLISQAPYGRDENDYLGALGLRVIRVAESAVGGSG